MENNETKLTHIPVLAAETVKLLVRGGYTVVEPAPAPVAEVEQPAPEQSVPQV